ncbi:hypothetical protein K503DRAFT_228582, partial [Rhizopogon vinicolor AM-OR11-026]
MKQRLITWLAQAAKAAGTDPLQDRGIRISLTLQYLLRNVPFEVVKTKGRWASNTPQASCIHGSMPRSWHPICKPLLPSTKNSFVSPCPECTNSFFL